LGKWHLIQWSFYIKAVIQEAMAIYQGMRKSFCLPLLGALMLLAIAGCSEEKVKTNSPAGRPEASGVSVAPTLLANQSQVAFLSPEGRAWEWSFGQEPKLSGTNRWKAYAIGTGTLGIKHDGTLWYSGSWPESNSFKNYPDHAPLCLSKEQSWSQVAFAGNAVLALKNDGTAWGARNSPYGEHGLGHTNFVPNLEKIEFPNKVQFLTGGGLNGYAITEDGALWYWGLKQRSNDPPAVTRPVLLTEEKGWKQISAQFLFLAAVKSNGSLWVFGERARNSGLHRDPNPDALVQIGTNTHWSEVVAGNGAFFARAKDGSWWRCGSDLGNLGGSTLGKTHNPPEKVEFPFQPVSFAVGLEESYAFCNEGKLWNWGRSRIPSEVLFTVNRVLDNLPGRKHLSPMRRPDPVDLEHQ
jgi:alpha-tubulin suppressor-like RCC1 family protein